MVTVSDDPALLSDAESSRCANSNGEVEGHWAYIQCEDLISGRYVQVAPMFIYGDLGSFCLLELQVVGYLNQ